MKTRTAATRALFEIGDEVKPGVIRLMAHGKAVAYVCLASEYDEEDIAFMTDPDFWKMISDRRKSNKGSTLEEVTARLEEREAKQVSNVKRSKLARVKTGKGRQ